MEGTVSEYCIDFGTEWCEGGSEGGAPEAHVPCYVADGTGLNEI
jgi:hypothetical protein